MNALARSRIAPPLVFAVLGILIIFVSTKVGDPTLLHWVGFGFIALAVIFMLGYADEAEQERRRHEHQEMQEGITRRAAEKQAEDDRLAAALVKLSAREPLNHDEARLIVKKWRP